MPAWSRPGTHRLGSPSMRCQRIMMSSNVTNRVCPLCSPPVTLGGGMVMTKGGRLPKFGCDSGRNRSCLTQKSYQRASISAGLYGAYVSGGALRVVVVAEDNKLEDAADGHVDPTAHLVRVGHWLGVADVLLGDLVNAGQARQAHGADELVFQDL